MDILKLLKQGWSPEDIMEEFDEAMQIALTEYEKYQEEERRKEAARKAQEEQKEYALMKQKEAREALGAALVNFAIAYDITDIDEAYLAAVDKYITLMTSPNSTICVGARGSKSNGKVIIYG